MGEENKNEPVYFLATKGLVVLFLAELFNENFDEIMNSRKEMIEEWTKQIDKHVMRELYRLGYIEEKKSLFTKIKEYIIG
jgi:hypothetical protein